MFANTKAFSGFAVDDMDKAREFYGETLGLKTSTEHGLMTLHLAGERPTLVYPKPDHTPADYTILNFPVEDIDKAVDEIGKRGVQLERYDGFEQDEKGNFRRGGALHRLVQGPRGERAVRAPGAVAPGIQRPGNSKGRPRGRPFARCDSERGGDGAAGWDVISGLAFSPAPGAYFAQRLAPRTRRRRSRDGGNGRPRERPAPPASRQAGDPVVPLLSLVREPKQARARSIAQPAGPGEVGSDDGVPGGRAVMQDRLAERRRAVLHA